MIEYPLIVFEGIDHSGKTTLSQTLTAKYPEFKWAHEPTFPSEQADLLNSDEYKGNDAKREVLFLESRLAQQSLYRHNPVFLDRYLWSGLAYAKAFSPSIYPFCVELYQNYNIFKKPTVTFFMDTPSDVCYTRKGPDSKETVASLELLRQAYLDTKDLVNTEIVIIDGTKSPEECVEQTEAALRKYIPSYFLSSTMSLQGD